MAGSAALFFPLRSLNAREGLCRLSAVLMCLSALHFPVKILQYKESFLFLSMLGYQTFAIEVILNSRQRASRTAKIFQDPRRSSAQKGNAFQHGNLALVKVFLILLAPACERISMIAKARVAPEVAHDERLIVL